MVGDTQKIPFKNTDDEDIRVMLDSIQLREIVNFPCEYNRCKIFHVNIHFLQFLYFSTKYKPKTDK